MSPLFTRRSTQWRDPFPKRGHVRALQRPRAVSGRATGAWLQEEDRPCAFRKCGRSFGEKDDRLARMLRSLPKCALSFPERDNRRRATTPPRQTHRGETLSSRQVSRPNVKKVSETIRFEPQLNVAAMPSARPRIFSG